MTGRKVRGLSWAGNADGIQVCDWVPQDSFHFLYGLISGVQPFPPVAGSLQMAYKIISASEMDNPF